jgi:hypothetical protein
MSGDRNSRPGRIDMKRIFLSALIGVGVASLICQLFSGTRAARLTEDYPLVCRGSETFKLDPPVPCEGCTNATPEEPLRYVEFTFIRGSKPSGKGLAPGECSWLDRGMWADEPDKIVQEIEGVGVAEKHAWIKELHSPDSYWTFNVHSSRGRLWATGAERNGKPVVSDKGFPVGSVEVKSPDLYIAEIKIIDFPVPSVGIARLAARVGNKGTGDAGEVILDLKRMRVCKDQPVPRSYRQMAVPALRSGQEEWIYFDGFDRDWGTYITREGKTASRLELTINPSDLYPDCHNVSPVMNYVKTEKEAANNSFAFDPKAP